MYITDCHHKSGHAITKSFSLGLTILCTGKAYYSEQDQQQLLQLQCSVEIFKTKILKLRVLYLEFLIMLWDFNSKFPTSYVAHYEYSLFT